MYFNEKKEDTNIDSEFKNNKKFSLDFKNLKLKPLLFIVVGIILLLVIILIIISLTRNSSKYTLELYGNERITISLNGEYIEPGYKAYDKKDNDVTEQVEVLNSVDSTKEGEYEILYSIGNINKVRYVTVVEVSSETYIVLKGETKVLYLEVGEKYTEPGYDVYDNIDDDLKSKVKITGTVDTSKVGTYKLTYSVVNSRNITSSVTRTVVVVEKGKKPQN